MKRRTKIAVGLVIVLAGVAVTVAWWWKTRQHQPAAGPATARVAQRDFASAVQATGAVKPQVGAEVRVGSRISGKLQRLPANIGDRVTQGQVIAELDKKADLEAVVAQRRADVAVGEARVTDADARLKLAALELDRAQSLRTNQIASQQELDSAGMTFAVAEAALRLAKRQVEAAQAALQESEARLSYATITAPISGVIDSVSTQEGETVSAGLSAPTFVTLIDLNRLLVDAFVDEVDIGKVGLGQHALFTMDAFPGKEFEGKVAAIYPKAVIQENLEKTYATGTMTTPVLKGVNFRVQAGEFAAIMGASGTGKSTLLNLLGCLDKPTSGRYRLDGTEVMNLDDAALSHLRSRKIGFVFQQFHLLARANALKNVLLPLIYADVYPKDAEHLGKAALGSVGLADRIHYRPSELSGGQQQRVAIARALMTNPAIILADEPTGNLDRRSGLEILAIFQRLHREGRTIIVVTHDQDIAEHADRVLLMRDGQIAEDRPVPRPRDAAQELELLPPESAAAASTQQEGR
ncbi:MAG: efflux RND transporter periplasmic adaptor subunit [Verrucomicrobia bacterium]|nr:efflux RND transporter periplasmic adaptor subunit [Verrucomicrobiota bacterium]